MNVKIPPKITVSESEYASLFSLSRAPQPASSRETSTAKLHLLLCRGGSASSKKLRQDVRSSASSVSCVNDRSVASFAPHSKNRKPRSRYGADKRKEKNQRMQCREPESTTYASKLCAMGFKKRIQLVWMSQAFYMCLLNHDFSVHRGEEEEEEEAEAGSVSFSEAAATLLMVT